MTSYLQKIFDSSYQVNIHLQKITFSSSPRKHRISHIRPTYLLIFTFYSCMHASVHVRTNETYILTFLSIEDAYYNVGEKFSLSSSTSSSPYPHTGLHHNMNLLSFSYGSSCPIYTCLCGKGERKEKVLKSPRRSMSTQMNRSDICSQVYLLESSSENCQLNSQLSYSILPATLRSYILPLLSFP